MKFGGTTNSTSAATTDAATMVNVSIHSSSNNNNTSSSNNGKRTKSSDTRSTHVVEVDIEEQLKDTFPSPQASSNKKRQVRFDKKMLSKSSSSSSSTPSSWCCCLRGGSAVGASPSSPDDDEEHDDRSTNSQQLVNSDNRLYLIVTLIVILGAATGGALLAIGLTSANDSQTELFQRRASDLVTQIQRSWNDYVTAAAWVHGRCRDRQFTRADFRRSYEYLVNSGLDFQAVQYDPNVTRAERPLYEAEAEGFYAQNYPSIEYRGFVGFEYDNSTSLEPRSEQDYYFPIHYMEPVDGNVAAIDLDYHSSGSRKRTVLHCMSQGLPGLTDRLRLVQETTESAYGVVLMHPGYDLTETSFLYETNGLIENADVALGETIPPVPMSPSALQAEAVWPRDLASIVIRIPDLIRRAAEDRVDNLRVYLYDASDTSTMVQAAADGDNGANGRSPDSRVFLGAAEVTADDVISLSEQAYDDLVEEINESDLLYQDELVDAANKNWVVVVHSVPGTYNPDISFVVLGAVIIFVASLGIAYWMYSNTKRVAQYQRLRSAAEAEKAALIIDSARQATKAERELNDFIAHEVRNPVAAAMCACSFVKSAVEDAEPLKTDSQRQEIVEDVNIIDNALKFVNDLLRNMLDMHRATNKQLKVNMAPTDIMHDVLESVKAMLPQRERKFDVLIECPDGLATMTDKLRLRQVVLNLARNSVKFIDRGFIKLRAEVVNGEVNIFVEDSGPGIPKEKREILFNKFQESLDSLSQGTGIGLFLCKNLVELMHGEISLDESYDSGIPGNLGTRFVVNLKQEAIDAHTLHDYDRVGTKSVDGTGDTHPLDDEEMLSVPADLPESLSVLFVDDDAILRKLFKRTLLTVAPQWKIREASNGETALQLVENNEHFDLIFMDMYMASVEKQLLGTEAVRELRNRGINARICGLSANDKESDFIEAGADAFSFK
mmetsp:Transcript_42487/g.102348  ORF Transcript_42487/g.102348 Transcript_42487/m.102348 type:complete len:947 (+) Transcript_42487:339-3179(+)